MLMMDVGTEFSSWDSFMQALQHLEKEQKCSYSVGTSKPCEAMKSQNTEPMSKLPYKFKFWFASLECEGPESNQVSRQGLNKKHCKSHCQSTIFVAVNKKRSALVIKEANWTHTHNVAEKSNGKHPKNQQLQGEERRMASVLLRAGVPLVQVHEFISSLQDSRGKKNSQLLEEKTNYLMNLDELMSEDPAAFVEVLHFDVTPGAIYLQTSEMMRRLEMLNNGMLQFVTYRVAGSDMFVLSALGVDNSIAKFGFHVLSQCLVLKDYDTIFPQFVELFFKHNPSYSDKVKGIVLDCSRLKIEFVQDIFPHADIAWSCSYVHRRFSEETQTEKSSDSQHRLVLQEALMYARSINVYESNLCEFKTAYPKMAKQFLNTWDSYRELWAQYEISKIEPLEHRDRGLETDFQISLKSVLTDKTSISSVIISLLKYDKSEHASEIPQQSKHSVHPCIASYRLFCVPEAAEVVSSQVSIALSSKYEFKEQTDMIFVKKLDSQEEVMLNIKGTKCTCSICLDSELPCHHIFAWLSYCKKSLYNEELIPERWQIFGKSFTLGALAESLSQGFVPSSKQLDDRLRELQTVVKNILVLCSAHSYDQIGKDILLLKKLLPGLKSCQSQDIYVEVKSKESDEEPVKETNLPLSSVRRRGRPPKNSYKVNSPPIQTPTQSSKKSANVSSPLVVTRHNLRTNIKHKFVTRVPGTDQVDNPNKLTPVTQNENNTVLDTQQKRSEKTVNDNSTFSLVKTRIIEERRKETPSKESVTKLNENDAIVNPSVSLKVTQVTQKPPVIDATIEVLSTSTTVAKDEKATVIQTGQKRKHDKDSMDENSEEEEGEEEDDDEGNEDDDDEDEETDDDDGEISLEKLEAKRQRMHSDADIFLNSHSQGFLKELLQTLSTTWAEKREGALIENRVRPMQTLVHSSLFKNSAMKDYILEKLQMLDPGFDSFIYQVGSCVLCLAYQMGVPTQHIMQCAMDWPSHLPSLPVSRSLEEELTLTEGQSLTVCGYKLDRQDLANLQSDMTEISSKVIHAYLEVLALKHSGKMFVIPYDVVSCWRQGLFSEKLFKKVHFKTFEYLVLPIHCGAEFTETERQKAEFVLPSWMALVADVQRRTVSMLNPRSEDSYVIAANGYMLQFRRYMQIRSVYTGEMLSSWTTRKLSCFKQEADNTSGILLLMNIEALISGVLPVVMNEGHIEPYKCHVAFALRDTDRETTVLCVGGPQCQEQAAQDADWLQCENCRTWWHRACAGHVSGAVTFYCSSCEARIESVGGKSKTWLEEGRINETEGKGNGVREEEEEERGEVIERNEGMEFDGEGDGEREEEREKSDELLDGGEMEASEV